LPGNTDQNYERTQDSR